MSSLCAHTQPHELVLDEFVDTDAGKEHKAKQHTVLMEVQAVLHLFSREIDRIIQQDSAMPKRNVTTLRVQQEEANDMIVAFYVLNDPWMDHGEWVPAKAHTGINIPRGEVHSIRRATSQLIDQHRRIRGCTDMDCYHSQAQPFDVGAADSWTPYTGEQRWGAVITTSQRAVMSTASVDVAPWDVPISVNAPTQFRRHIPPIGASVRMLWNIRESPRLFTPVSDMDKDVEAMFIMVWWTYFACQCHIHFPWRPHAPPIPDRYRWRKDLPTNSVLRELEQEFPDKVPWLHSSTPAGAPINYDWTCLFPLIYETTWFQSPTLTFKEEVIQLWTHGSDLENYSFVPAKSVHVLRPWVNGRRMRRVMQGNAISSDAAEAAVLELQAELERAHVSAMYDTADNDTRS